MYVRFKRTQDHSSSAVHSELLFVLQTHQMLKKYFLNPAKSNCIAAAQESLLRAADLRTLFI